MWKETQEDTERYRELGKYYTDLLRKGEMNQRQRNSKIWLKDGIKILNSSIVKHPKERRSMKFVI